MKSILIILFFSIHALNVLAQEPINSSAKTAYTTLKNTLDKLSKTDPSKGEMGYSTDVEKAQKRIQTIEKNEPGFDLSKEKSELAKFEKILDDYRNNKLETQSKNDAITEDASQLAEEMKTLFREPDISYFDGKDKSKMEDDIKNFDKECQTFLATNPAQRISDAKSVHRYHEPEDIYYGIGTADKNIADLEDAINRSTEQNYIDACYYVIKKREVFWRTLKQCFPDDTSIASVHEKYVQSLKKVGSPESFADRGSKNEAKSLAKVFMKPAVRTEFAIEELFKNAFNATGWNEEIKKIHLLDSDWYIDRHKVTGVILGRYQTADIAAKNSKGECLVYTFTIYQEYDGSGYQKTAKRASHNALFMDCNNIK